MTPVTLDNIDKVVDRLLPATKGRFSRELPDILFTGNSGKLNAALAYTYIKESTLKHRQPIPLTVKELTGCTWHDINNSQPNVYYTSEDLMVEMDKVQMYPEAPSLIVPVRTLITADTVVTSKGSHMTVRYPHPVTAIETHEIPVKADWLMADHEHLTVCFLR